MTKKFETVEEFLARGGEIEYVESAGPDHYYRYLDWNKQKTPFKLIEGWKHESKSEEIARIINDTSLQ